MRRADARVGVFLLEGFQELEFWYPVLRLREEGVPVTVIGADTETTAFSKLGYPVVAEAAFERIPPEINVLVVPGTTTPLTSGKAAVIAALKSTRPALLAATGASVQLVGEAGLLRGVQVAAPASSAATLRELGANPADRAVCIDRNVVTARGVDDMPEFFKTLLAALG
ncbi:MAG TPA: DJ-1/PfpI family protein [Casimicrobiaceae bacterium]|nr:DJ-1/PfpI family protein [Casimicrobiaceae bacterium]